MRFHPKPHLSVHQIGLRDMEEKGLLTRTVYAEVPPRVEYTLTELGYSLKPVLDSLWNWGEAYKASVQNDLE